jgi:hypothetical protein
VLKKLANSSQNQQQLPEENQRVVISSNTQSIANDEAKDYEPPVQ